MSWTLAETRDIASPKIVEEDEAFIFAWQETGYGIGLSHLKESSEGLHAEIMVKTANALLNGGTGHVHWARVNIASTQSRSTLVRYLNERVNTVDWHSMVEYACTVTAQRHRRGEPFVDLAEVEAPDDVPWLIRDMFPLGETSILFAPGGSSKSILALAIAVAVTTGVPVGNLFLPTRQAPVLYLDWETRKETHARRLHWLCRGLGLRHVPHIHYRRQYRPLADDIGQIKTHVRAKNIGLIVVDSLAPACGGEQEKAEAAIRGLNALRGLGADVTSLAISHVTKAVGEQRSGQAKPFGSVFVENLGRNLWEVRRAAHIGKSGVDVGLFNTKVNDGQPAGPFGARIIWDAGAKSARIDRRDIGGDEELMAHGGIGERVLALLRQGGEWETQKIADELESTPNVVRATLSRLREDETVSVSRQEGNRKWWRVVGDA